MRAFLYHDIKEVTKFILTEKVLHKEMNIEDDSPGKQRALQRAIGKYSKSRYQLLSSPQNGHLFLLPAKLSPVFEM